MKRRVGRGTNKRLKIVFTDVESICNFARASQILSPEIERNICEGDNIK